MSDDKPEPTEAEKWPDGKPRRPVDPKIMEAGMKALDRAAQEARQKELHRKRSQAIFDAAMTALNRAGQEAERNGNKAIEDRVLKALDEDREKARRK